MKCYRCGSELGRQDICLTCGAPLKTYRIIVKRANSLYNSGLEKARVRDLTGAIEDLQQCLVYYKGQIQARNLLGLIYHEIGEDAEAMAEWVISENYQPENNLATTLMEKMSDADQLSQCNAAVQYYNHSLALAKGPDQSYDLALLELQKVIRVNSHFMKAYQLLALLYIQKKDYTQANKTLKTALKINRSDEICLRYRQEIAGKTGRKSEEAQAKAKKGKARDKDSGNNDVIIPTYREGSGILQAVLYVLGGIVLGLLVCTFLVVPTIRQNIQQEANERVISYSNLISDRDVEILNLEAELEAVREEAEAASDQLDSYVGKDGVIESYEQLLRIVTAYYTEGYFAIVDEFDQLDSTIDGTVYQEVYQQLAEMISGSGRDELYAAGYEAYQQRDYETAKDYLTRCLQIDPDYVDALYWLGLCYHNTEDKATADEYYTRIIEEYPDTSYAQSAAELRGY